MNKKVNTAIILSFFLNGCSQLGALRTDLSAKPVPSTSTETALINALMEPLDTTDKLALYKFKDDADPKKVSRYLNAGMTLSDIFCDEFFRQTNAAYRKRKFGRGATNDVGTAVAAVLGLSGVGPNIIAGAATSFGLADTTWRNYDESFLVSPQLATMRSLVMAAQDKFRADTFKQMPKDYMTARSIIVRYSATCSFLGMQGLLDQSVDQQRRQLQEAVAPVQTAPPAPNPKPAQPQQPALPNAIPQTTDAQIPTVPIQ